MSYYTLQSSQLFMPTDTIDHDTDGEIVESSANTHGLILTGVRNGGAADLRRAIVQAENGHVSLPTVRSTVAIRIRESLRHQGLPVDLVSALKSALDQLRKGEEVHVPFFSNGSIETVCVPFEVDQA